VLIGSDEVSIQRSVFKLLDRYAIDIVYYRNGFFSSEMDRQACLQFVKSMKPDLVVVGMGTPLQERFLVDLVSIGWKGRGYSCGGYFHQLGGDNRSNYYPNWMNSLHLRWLYRVWDEPKLISRYLFVYPYFFISSWLHRFLNSTL
jgi:N-acetylglucosaminyldiphosphoundecaprenol N-acetyl-beta-D-mannosaminyltransferase